MEWLRQKILLWLLQPNSTEVYEDLTGVKYHRIYYATDHPMDIKVSWNAYDRKHQDPKGCVTIGWVLIRGGSRRVLRVEGVS